MILIAIIAPGNEMKDLTFFMIEYVIFPAHVCFKIFITIHVLYFKTLFAHMIDFD